ncbi:SPOR domain-containing protein [Acetobacteraceae bacterium KSS12]|uniref:SPOR domain-containing protein n=2 Tax=Rhizosaccharibacter radicis TaxID=2782605 RepID=A0ABT1VSF1_9PROT|nr:SPOR domain-containing protein [Acetobacteraceae bacterium KSS12]
MAASRGVTSGPWSIQVGAFNSVSQARFATTMARQAAFRQLAGTQSVVQPTAPFGGAVLYRARLAGLARADAGQACAALRGQSIPCMVVSPGG